MKKTITVFAAIACLALQGCVTTPENNPKIKQLQTQLEQTSSQLSANRWAPLPLQEAEEALNKTKQLWENDAPKDKLVHQIYLTEMQIAIMKEQAKMAKAEASINNAELKRKDTLLKLRSAEVETAKRKTQLSLQAASISAQRANELESKLAKLKNEVKDLKAENTDRGLVITLDNILFDLNKAEIKSGSQRTLDKVAAFLNEYDKRKVLIEGFTDNTGDDNYNKSLSTFRAEAVKQALAARNIDSSRIKVRGYGELYPIASNETAAGRQQNRRVEIVIANEKNAEVAERSQ